jgi:3-isopropylmalate dehydrogenase
MTMVEAQRTHSLNIAVIGGDGIGPEVVPRGSRSFPRSRRSLGQRPQGQHHRVRPGGAPLARHRRDPAGLGPGGDPRTRRDPARRRSGTRGSRAVSSSAGAAARLRFALDQYVNLRPVRLYPACRALWPRAGRAQRHRLRRRPRGHRGPYVGNGGALRSAPREIATEVSVNTAYGVRARRARRLRPAQAGTRKHLTWCTSTTCSCTPGTCGAGRSTRLGRVPDVATAYQHVDAATIFMVTDPGRST